MFNFFVINFEISDTKDSSHDTEGLKRDTEIELLKDQFYYVIEENLIMKRQLASLENKYALLVKTIQMLSKSYWKIVYLFLRNVNKFET